MRSRPAPLTPKDPALMSSDPAPCPSALIVAHGSPSEPQQQEDALAALAARVADHMPGWQISSATLACKDRFDEETARLGAPLIFPFFMAEGYFTRRVLATKAKALGLTMRAPFGVIPALEDVAEATLRAHIARNGWQIAETALLVAAHGSAVSTTSRNSALNFADRMQARCGFRRAATGFVEEPPFLADAARDLGPHSLCLTHFALRSGHVQEDLPEAFATAGFTGTVLPPMIEWPETPRLIADALTCEQG